MNEALIQEALECYVKIQALKKSMMKASWDYAKERRKTYSDKAIKTAERAGKFIGAWECFLAFKLIRMTQEEANEYYRRVDAVRNGTNTGVVEREENPGTVPEA